MKWIKFNYVVSEPCLPAGPTMPISPRIPVSPLCPFSPVIPINPCGPRSPCGPGLPSLPTFKKNMNIVNNKANRYLILLVVCVNKIYTYLLHPLRPSNLCLPLYPEVLEDLGIYNADSEIINLTSTASLLLISKSIWKIVL